MKKTTQRKLETFLLITFPLALFVGCADNGGIKPNALSESGMKSQTVMTSTAVSSTMAATEQNPATSLANREVHLLIDMLKHDQEAQALALNDEQAAETTSVIQHEAIPITWQSEADGTTLDEDQSIAVTFSPIKQAPLKQPDLSIINFASGDTDIDLSYLVSLQEHAKFLSQHPGLLLTVSGHSDSIGSEQTNMKLSEERATNVYNILLSYGAPAAQLVVDSFGETSPLNDEGNYQENRRVELEYSDEVVLSSR